MRLPLCMICLKPITLCELELLKDTYADLSGGTEAWRDYAIDRVHFGDQSAACQLEVSKELVANLGACISEDAAADARRLGST